MHIHWLHAMLDKSQNVLSVYWTTFVSLMSFLIQADTFCNRKNSRSLMFTQLLDSTATIGNSLSSFLMEKFSELSICAALSGS